jgi:hypothetical protein
MLVGMAGVTQILTAIEAGDSADKPVETELVLGMGTARRCIPA